MSRAELIQEYEDMAIKYGEIDAFEDDVKPKLKDLSTRKIREMYEIDREFYEEREAAGGCF